MAEYIERENALDCFACDLGKKDYSVSYQGFMTEAAFRINSIPAADVLPRDEAIKMGAELAAMHGSDATSQQLEESYLKGVEYGMTRRDVRPVVRGRWYWDKDGMDWNIGAWRCSACKAMSPMWWNADRGSPMHKSGHKFCPNCGAMMEEK